MIRQKILSVAIALFKIMCCIIFVVGFFYFCAHLMYGNFKMRQFLFHATALFTMGFSFSTLFAVIIPFVLIAAGGIYIVIHPLKCLRSVLSEKQLSFWRQRPIMTDVVMSTTAAICGLFLLVANSDYSLKDIFKQMKFLSAVVLHQEKYDTFFDNNYILPQFAQFKVDTPQNLIVIFAESLEQTYIDAEIFGENLLPRLSALQGVSVVGYQDQDEVNWTQASLQAALCGITSKLYLPPRNLNKEVKCIPSLLQELGYQTYYLQGTAIKFAGAREFLTDHGFAQIEGIEALQNVSPQTIYDMHFINKIQTDSVLLEHFRQKITELAAQKQPFFAVTMTMNTHPHHGHLENGCPEKYHDMRDAVLCADNELGKFVEWFKQQDFAADTTLVILGDHLLMYGDIYKYAEKAKNRETINLIWGKAAMPANIHKPFYQFDWAPTFLEMAGIRWLDHRWGLGVSLLSEAQTLAEIYGPDAGRRLLYNSRRYQELIKSNAVNAAK